MNEDLLEIFKNVNNWLKHAESKNAMLIAFNGTLIFGFIQTYNSELFTEVNLISYILFGSIFLLFISLLLAVLSFVPRLKMVNPGIGTKNSDSLNSLFFEHLKDMSKEQIYEKVVGNKTNENTKEINLDLAEQIRQNALISSRKYSHFTIAVWMTGFVLTIVLVVSIIYFLSLCY